MNAIKMTAEEFKAFLKSGKFPEGKASVSAPTLTEALDMLGMDPGKTAVIDPQEQTYLKSRQAALDAMPEPLPCHLPRLVDNLALNEAVTAFYDRQNPFSADDAKNMAGEILDMSGEAQAMISAGTPPSIALTMLTMKLIGHAKELMKLGYGMAIYDAVHGDPDFAALTRKP